MLRITAKTNGDFSYKIANLQSGTRVLLDGPRGAFTSKRAEEPSVTLIAGGIGIAPFLAKIPEFLTDHKKVTLLYSVRDSKSFAFRKELEILSRQGLVVHPFITNSGTRIDKRALSKTVDAHTTVFICGPDAMTSALPKMLVSLGIPKKNIITERFGF
jgi:ferredoxin-NADP reductase